MEYEKLKAEAEKIKMPDEMKRRIAENCKARRLNARVRKPAAAMAAFAICIVMLAGAWAAAGALRGCFRDIRDWKGAVTGTAYEQASDEIRVRAFVDGNELIAAAAFSTPREFPYREIERLGIAAYRIVDADGRVVKAGSTEAKEVANGQAAIGIMLDDIGSGSYRLLISAFFSEKKADQPLNIIGNWECAFEK